MGIETSPERTKRVRSSAARALAVVFAILLVGGFLLPLKQWWDLSSGGRALQGWAALLWALAGDAHLAVYLVGAFLLLMIFLTFAEAAGEMADAANRSFRQLTVRMIRVLPYTLLPLATSAAVVHSPFLMQVIHQRWSVAASEHRWSQSFWATLDVLVPCFTFLLALVCASTALGIVWWSCVERFKTPPVVEGQSRDLPRFATEFAVVPLLLGGIIGCGIAARLFGRPAPTRAIRMWLLTIAGAAALFTVVVHVYLIRRPASPRQAPANRHSVDCAPMTDRLTARAEAERKRLATSADFS